MSEFDPTTETGSRDPRHLERSAAAGQPLAKKTGRNAIYNLLTFVYPTALTIVVTPIVLHYIGTTRYGIFALATVLVGFLGVLDFGVGAATVRYVAQALAQGRLDHAARLVRASLFVFTVVGLTGCGFAAIVSRLFLSSWFHISAGQLAAAKFAFAGAGVGFLFTMTQGALAAVPAAAQRYDITAVVSVALTTLGTIGTIAALASGFGLRGMIVVAAAEPFIALIAYGWYARRILRVGAILPRWDPGLLREIASFSALTFIGNVNGLILFQFDKLLIGGFGTARQVTYYVVPGNIAQRIHSAAAALGGVILPSSTALAASADRQRITRLYVRATRLTTLFVVTAAVAPLALARQILHYWVGANIAAHSALILQLLIATYGLLALAVPSYFLALGHGRPGVAASFNGAMAAMNVPLVILLVPRYGSNGAAVAFVISMLPVVVFIAYVERRILVISPSPWLGTVGRLAVPALLAGGTALAVRDEVTNLAELLALLVVLLVAVPASYLALFAPLEDRSLARALLGKRFATNRDGV